MMRPPPSICSPRSRALLCASPLTPPMTRSPSTRPRGRGVRRSVVPPAKTATVSGHGPRSPARDRTIMLVKQLGRRQWKKVSGYHRQGRVENAFFRYKSIIGDGLRARSPAGQGSEVVIGCEILNRMTALGPTSVVSHRQVRILSVGLVRASDDSCNNAQGVGVPTLGPLSPFVGGGLGAARVASGETRMTFPKTRTVVPGTSRTGLDLEADGRSGDVVGRAGDARSRLGVHGCRRHRDRRRPWPSRMARRQPGPGGARSGTDPGSVAGATGCTSLRYEL